MKAAIAIIIIVGVIFGVYKGWEYWDTMKENETRVANSNVVQFTPSDQLQGLPKQLEASLQQAQKGGPKTMKAWLDAYRLSVKDPRLAGIELDYVLLITKDNPIEAKRIFRDVKARTSTDSPVYPRIQALEKTYE